MLVHVKRTRARDSLFIAAIFMLSAKNALARASCAPLSGSHPGFNNGTADAAFFIFIGP